MKTKNEPLVSLLKRLTELDVPPREMSMWRIHQMLNGEAMLVVARKRKCLTCGAPHRTAWAMVPALSHPLEEVYHK